MKNPLSKIFRKRAPRQQVEEPAPVAAPAGEPRKEEHLHGIVLHHEEGSNQVIFSNLVLHGPDGKPLVEYGDYTLSPGDSMVVSGPAGCGKSAGLAAMRGVWMLGGSGEITAPPEIRFVPQEEYFPDRTLRGLISSPDPVSAYTQEQVEKAMKDAGLGDFIPELDDETKRGEYWKNTLSGGQKNKLGFAGIFLHADKVKVLIVDEITAALDAKSEGELYPRLLDRMKHGIVITVAHHASIAPLHNVQAKVENGKVNYTRAEPEKKPSPSAKPPKPSP